MNRDRGFEQRDPKTTTFAERMAEDMGNDGSVFKSPDGRTLDQMCRAAGCSVEKGTDVDYDSVRYVFGDGSAIVDAHGAAWDIEGSEPFSWAGAE